MDPVSRVDSFPRRKLQRVVIYLGKLGTVQALVALLGIILVVHHRLALDEILQLGTFLLQTVVVVLEDLDQLLVVFDFLLVAQLNATNIEAIVVWHIVHRLQYAVLSDQVLDSVGVAVEKQKSVHGA